MHSVPSKPMSASATALQLSGVSRMFGGVTAVSEVTLQVPMSARHAIIGPNGAGKTTLFNMISGELGATSGNIRLFGRDITEMAPPQRVASGLGRTYQITRIFARLTVRENLTLALHGLRRSKYSMLKPWSAYDHSEPTVAELAGQFQLEERLETKAADLSHGEQRQLDVALAVALKPRVLLLDEPAAGLSPGERVNMRRLLKDLPPDMTLVMIEHDMDLVRDVATWVDVLNFGRLVASGSVADVQNDERVREIYLGSRD